jgi:hypothetical protein
VLCLRRPTHQISQLTLTFVILRPRRSGWGPKDLVSVYWPRTASLHSLYLSTSFARIRLPLFFVALHCVTVSLLFVKYFFDWQAPQYSVSSRWLMLRY